MSKFNNIEKLLPKAIEFENRWNAWREIDDVDDVYPAMEDLEFDNIVFAKEVEKAFYEDTKGINTWADCNGFFVSMVLSPSKESIAKFIQKMLKIREK